MKNKISIIISFFSLCYACTSDDIKQPAIFKSNYPKGDLTQVLFHPSSFIFDTIKHKELNTGFFYIINVGKNPLRIDSVTKTCNCTSLIDLKKSVQPGDSLKVNFTITPNEKNDYFVSPLMFFFKTKPFYRQYLIEGYSK